MGEAPGRKGAERLIAQLLHTPNQPKHIAGSRTSPCSMARPPRRACRIDTCSSRRRHAWTLPGSHRAPTAASILYLAVLSGGRPQTTYLTTVPLPRSLNRSEIYLVCPAPSNYSLTPLDRFTFEHRLSTTGLPPQIYHTVQHGLCRRREANGACACSCCARLSRLAERCVW